MNLKIFQTIHKPFPRKSCDWITPVAVGNYSEPGAVKDNTGDNISHLNPYYAEFTTMYWAWKNAQDYDAIGFYHYRRYLHVMHHEQDFTWEGKIDKGSHFQVDYTQNQHFLETVASDAYKNRIIDMLSATEVISGFPMRFDVPIPQQWIQHHPVEPLQVFLDELVKQYPNHQQLIKVFFSKYGQICWPVFVMRRETFMKFADELFGLLHNVFAKIGTPYDAYNNRYVCFLVERFLPLWFMLHRINPNFVPTVTFFSNQHSIETGDPLPEGHRVISGTTSVRPGFSG